MRLAKPLTGDRITLDTLNPDGPLSHYVDWLNDTEINRFLESRFATHTTENIAAFIRRNNESDDSLLLGITLNMDARHVGNIKLGPINAHHRRGDVGLLIGDRSVWGRGIATEAIKLITHHAIGRLNLHKVCAGVYGANTGSMKAFEKAGYVRAANIRDHWRLDDGWTDHVLYEAVSGAWNEP
jgi:RimJ/RimL family protein N-acetyltransferase